jgi:hypothetical protein
MGNKNNSINNLKGSKGHQNMKNANDLLTEHNCSDEYYQHGLSKLHYTSGVQSACTRFKCYWFLDVVMSYQTGKFQEDNEFQVWKLQRQSENEFIAICEDGDDNKIITQLIEFSDFEHDNLTFWFTNRIVILPSEY